MILELHIPGLLAAPARLLSQLELPGAPSLRAINARATAASAPGGRHGAACRWMNVDRMPLAALEWCGATGAFPSTPTLRLELVHLKAGMTDLVLFAGPAVRPDDDELASIAADLGKFLEGEPRLVQHAGKLFLVDAALAGIKTTPLHRAQGHAVGDLLPRGAHATRVHAWMNEIQMFLHRHPVNLARAEAGKPVLNGAWLFGEGDSPSPQARDIVVHGEALWLKGLAHFLGTHSGDMSLTSTRVLQGHHVFSFSDCVAALDADDVGGWRQAVERLDRKVLQPALQLSKERRLELVLHAGDGLARHMQHGTWMRWLRRAPPLQLVEE